MEWSKCLGSCILLVQYPRNFFREPRNSEVNQSMAHRRRQNGTRREKESKSFACGVCVYIYQIFMHENPKIVLTEIYIYIYLNERFS